jgi:hypothetical protein
MNKDNLKLVPVTQYVNVINVPKMESVEDEKPVISMFGDMLGDWYKEQGINYDACAQVLWVEYEEDYDLSIEQVKWLQDFCSDWDTYFEEFRRDDGCSYKL